jgi:hypothetical protein
MLHLPCGHDACCMRQGVQCTLYFRSQGSASAVACWCGDCGVYGSHRARCTLDVPSAACLLLHILYYVPARFDFILHGGDARLAWAARRWSCRTCYMCSQHVAHVVSGSCCMLHVAHCALFAASCARHGRVRHASTCPASCTVHVARCIGRTARLRRFAPPQCMLRDARRPGLRHACGASCCMPHGAAHGECRLLPSAFADRRCAALLCAGHPRWRYLP